ncbi:hypothetical protein G5V65_11330 [Rhodobacter sp. HX-7-19]|uniref:Uncharacterized protein n=1 Tax=Paragemmobacter kunshanensis TaxID=2583234 RepID=A0A6M1TN58_9RHOB|nr:hypothetical protein [Rhodobacter kunshanensis]NGQ91489.1 hypothetical protein [Rhodobacter kunshanensis]
MSDNPFAALLDGVPRRVIEDGGDALYHGKRTTYLPETDVLAALAAAVPADLAEASGGILRTLRDDQDLLTSDAADLIATLLARIAAQEAVNNGLKRYIQGYRQATRESARQFEAELDRAEATETALAAERAKTARLVEALKIIAEAKDLEAPSEYNRGWNNSRSRLRDAARAAITEAGQ